MNELNLNFNHRLNIRITENQYADINHIIANTGDKYTDVSHFVRCAVIKLIREEK